MKRGVALAVIAAAFLLGTAQAKPFSYKYKTKYADVQFSWSSEAAAIPRLVARFRADLAKAKAETISGGKEDYALRQIGWATITKISTSGQTPRLLSLARESWEFTGGAHGNGGTSSLLWDRQLGREISFASLFASQSGYVRVLRGPYCRALDVERKKRRGGETAAQLGMLPEFGSCPKLSDLALIPADADRNGKLQSVHLVANAYLAGPYVEGEYDIKLPVSQQLIGMMKPQYGASFEAQRQ